MVKPKMKKNLRDEFVCLIATQCLATAYANPKTNLKGLQDCLFLLYHGKEGSDLVSHKHDFVKGQGVYEQLWTVDENQGGKPIIDSKYHQSGSILYQGEVINTEVMEKKSGNSTELISGRTLHDQAVIAKR